MPNNSDFLYIYVDGFGGPTLNMMFEQRLLLCWLRAEFKLRNLDVQITADKTEQGFVAIAQIQNSSDQTLFGSMTAIVGIFTAVEFEKHLHLGYVSCDPQKQGVRDFYPIKTSQPITSLIPPNLLPEFHASNPS